MVKILIGNKDTKEINTICQTLANDKDYKVRNVSTGKDAVFMYLKTNPDILILDDSLSNIEDIINRLSADPVERKRSNIILTMVSNYTLKLRRYSKINEIVYKPYLHKDLINAIKDLAIDYNTPDIEYGEIDWILQSLNFNCLSLGFRLMKKAISYCYYKPYELEHLNNVLKHLSYEFNIKEYKVRDSLNACIRPFNNASEYDCPKKLFRVLHNNRTQIIS